ncbi:hypothetical protein PsAD5_01568 [Pseudovibrio sp. Ad5]|uniref:hypothetical protein n=1 Tax=Pseudovibrio sp. Ad5 TaxID=989436 RepID=UPI0007AEA567|nr:hypothetical protein [Pseudovibrio sp. Ad5]KZK98945.1 hypothetical protein PsAD5_01568 [Pseudovibrio sp. Ad5]
MNASNGTGSRHSYDHKTDWSDDHYSCGEYYEDEDLYDDNGLDEEGLDEEGVEEEGSADEDLVDEDLHQYRPSWGAVMVACLTCFALGSFLFSGADESDIENRLSRLEGAVHLVASVTPMPLSATSLTAQPVIIDPPVIIDREANRLVAPETIFKREALASETISTPLKPIGQIKLELDADGEAS